MTEPALAESVKGYGRMYRHPVNGALYPSVTNIIDVLAKPWLAGWKAKMVAGYAWDSRFALMKMDREQAIGALKGGPDRERDAAASLGDTLHEYAEAVASGREPPPLTEDQAPFAATFREFISEYGVAFHALEGCIFAKGPEDPERYAGSFDALALVLNAYGALIDYKTGKSIYDEVALQLAALSRGDELWDETTGELGPMPKVEVCLGVHIRPGKLGVHIVRADDDAYQAFLGLRRAWPWDKDHTGAVGPRLNPVRLERELRRPDNLLDQLEQSVEESSRDGVDGARVGKSGSANSPASAEPAQAPDADGAPSLEDPPAAETTGEAQRSAGQPTSSPVGVSESERLRSSPAGDREAARG